MIDPVTLNLLLRAGPPVVLAVIKLLRGGTVDADATEIEAALARADSNFNRVIHEASAALAGAGGGATLPEPGSVDEGR